MELLIVFAVIGLLVAVVAPQFYSMRENQVVRSGAQDIVTALNKAKAGALGGADSSEYGVRFEPEQVIVFKGILFSVSDPLNEVYPVVSPATISNVTLGGMSGSNGELYFNRISGTPSKTGTVTVSSSSMSQIITISATGAVSLE